VLSQLFHGHETENITAVCLQGPEDVRIAQQALRFGERENFLANGLKLFVGHGTAWLLVQPPRPGEIEMLGGIATGVEFPIKRFGVHLA